MAKQISYNCSKCNKNVTALEGSSAELLRLCAQCYTKKMTKESKIPTVKEKETIRIRALGIVSEFENRLQTNAGLIEIWATLDDNAQQDILECCVGVLLEEFGY